MALRRRSVTYSATESNIKEFVLGHIQIRTETPGVMLWVFFLIGFVE